MPLFGSGIGATGDVCGCCCVFVFLGAGVILAVVGVVTRSGYMISISSMLTVFNGIVLLTEAMTHELRDTGESRDVHEMLWAFVWWWAASLCAPLVAAACLMIGPEKPAPVPSPPPAPAPDHGRDWRGNVAWVFWLLVLGLLTYLIAKATG